MLRTIKQVLTIITVIAMLGLPLGAFAAEQININTATASQLQNIKGVGGKTANKIVAYRKQHGQFTSIDELCKIQGIGEKSLQKMSSDICVK